MHLPYFGSIFIHLSLHYSNEAFNFSKSVLLPNTKLFDGRNEAEVLYCSYVLRDVDFGIYPVKLLGN